MTPIKTIIFDLGGVYFTDGSTAAIEAISLKYNIPKEKVSEVLKGKSGTDYRIGAVTVDEFWNDAKELWGTPSISSDDLTAIWVQGYKPIQGTIEIIRNLKKNGYELLFLSDNVKERVEYLEKKYNFLSDFNGGIFSHIVKTRKPDPAIYEHVLKLSSHPASECVYIDDKEELLAPAREMGMKTICFKLPEQLRQELLKLGITCN